MKVILTQEVLGLGDPGDVVNVKNGYGRNYLLPRGMALQATKKNLAMIEAERRRIAATQAREAEKVKDEADALAGTEVTIEARAGETGKLYGSVTNMDVAAALAQAGFDIDRRRILMDAPIKSLGQHLLKVKLHPQVVVEITVNVISNQPEPEESETPAEETQAESAPEAAETDEAQAEAPAQDEAAPEQEAQTQE